MPSGVFVPSRATPSAEDPTWIHQVARLGTSGTGGALPHLDTIQKSFGRHDLTGVVTHTDDSASTGAQAMGASAFTFGNHIAFDGPPSLSRAAHEAAHVVQQRGGVQLAGGIGRAGDPYEKHAEEVADLVVRGQSAEALLDRSSRFVSGCHCR
jgi:hypothetical protein